MNLGLSARDRRTLIGGVATMGTLLVLARGVPALIAWQSDRVAEATVLMQQAQSTRTGIRTLPEVRDSLRAREIRLASFDSVILSGASAAAAAADLAATLEEMADAAPIKVASMQLRADSAAPGSLTTVAVRVTGTTDVAGLSAFLRAVEGGEAPLRVRELAVTQPDPAAPPNRVESLRIDALVEGLAQVIGKPVRRP